MKARTTQADARGPGTKIGVSGREWQRLALLGLAAAGGVSAPEAHAHLRRTDPAIGIAVVTDLLHGLLTEGLVEVDQIDGHAFRITASGRSTRDEVLSQLCATLGLPDPATLDSERERIDRLRTDLLSTVSHELRTPLTLIRTSVGLLLDSEPDEAMQLRLLRNIKQSADRMHALVADLLDLVRLRHDQVELVVREIDVGALVAGAAALIRPLIDEKNQQLSLDVSDPPPVVWGDYRRLERVLLNLLSNANLYAPTDASISIRARDEGTMVRIAVADNGPGIASEAQDQLFEQFYTARTSSSSRNIGVGLGLPIAKGVVEAHGGRIEVDSDVGRGSTFHVTLPHGPHVQGPP